MMAQNKFLQADSTFYVKMINKITTLASNNVWNVEHDNKNFFRSLHNFSKHKIKLFVRQPKNQKCFLLCTCTASLMKFNFTLNCLLLNIRPNPCNKFTCYRKDMNVNAALDLLDLIAKKSMLVPQVHVQIMAFVLTYRKDMKAIHINVCVHMVSIICNLLHNISTESLTFGFIIIIKHVFHLNAHLFIFMWIYMYVYIDIYYEQITHRRNQTVDFINIFIWKWYLCPPFQIN